MASASPSPSVDRGRSARRAAAVLGEPHAGLDLVAQPRRSSSSELIFSRRLVETFWSRNSGARAGTAARLAPLAAVGPDAVGHRVEVAAGRAELGLLGGELVVLLDREDDPVDLVARALVVDDRAGPELGDRQEPGPRHELVPRLPRPPGRDVGRQRQPGEVVAGQEPLAGEVAVAVEVRLGAGCSSRSAGRAATRPRGAAGAAWFLSAAGREASPMIRFWASRWATAARYSPRHRSQAASNRLAAWASTSSSQPSAYQSRRRAARRRGSPGPARRAPSPGVRGASAARLSRTWSSSGSSGRPRSGRGRP